ncbi:hypothetical protein Tco_0911163 [Tanacetum coccineum]|uniref:CheW-like domain-containing protein n=1 Tax=Tanacetum coccineum TaxID=301880 RepID=A0ABQ5CX67_9ASTR
MGSFPTPWFGGGESDEVDVEGVGVGKRSLLPLDLSRKTLLLERGIMTWGGESFLLLDVTLIIRVRQISESKIESFASGETIEACTQRIHWGDLYDRDAYGIFTDDVLHFLNLFFNS